MVGAVPGARRSRGPGEAGAGQILGGEPEPEQAQPGPGLATSKPNKMFDIESMPDLLRPCGAGQYSGQAGGARGDETYQLIQATSHDIGGRGDFVIYCFPVMNVSGRCL